MDDDNRELWGTDETACRRRAETDPLASDWD